MANNPDLLPGLHLAIGALSKYVSAVRDTRKDPQHTNSNRALQAAIQQQLQDSRLLQQLPGMLSVATARVLGSARNAQQENDPARQVPDLADLASPVSRAVALLWLYCEWVELFAPERPSDTILDRPTAQALGTATVAILRLAAALMSRCGWRCGSMPGPQLPPSAVRELLPGFLPAVGMVAVKTCHLMTTMKTRAPSGVHTWSLQDGPHVQQLLASDCIVPLLAACISSLACHALDAQLTGTASRATSSSSSSHNEQQASVRLQPTTNLQLLLDCFGIDSATAVCAGRVLQVVHKGLWAAALGIMLRFYSEFNYVWIQAAAQQTGAAQGLPLVSPQEQQLHLLLPAVALQWATSCLPAPSDNGSSSGTGAAAQELHLMACEAVSGACFSGIDRWKICAFCPATAADSWLQQAFPLEDWAAELLPLLLKFASSSMAEGSRLAELVDAAGQQALGGSSSSSMSSRHRSYPAVTQRLSEQSIRAHEITGTTVAAMSLLLDILDSTVGADVSSSSSSSSSSSNDRSSSVSRQPGSQDLQAMLRPHVLQLLQTFEAFTRSTASLAAAETRVGTVAGGSFCTAAGRRAADSSYSVCACQCILITIVRGPNSPLVASAIAAGLSSQECQQLCSLLLSLLKTCRLVRLSLSAGMQQSVLQTVAAVLQSPAAVLAESAAAPAGTLQPPTPAAEEAAGSPLVCMLQLFGRACLQLAQLTQEDESGFTQCLPSLKNAAAACPKALQEPPLSQQLSVAGCDPQQLLAQLRELLAVLQQDAGAFLTRVQLQRQLQAAGAAFTAVPSNQMCNNPGCSCVDGISEQGLVARRSSLCAGCRTARYCGRSCLAAHWKRHKPVCKAIAAAAAGMAE